MRISKKFLAILLTLLLATLAIVVPQLPVLAASVTVAVSPISSPPGTTVTVHGTGFSIPATYYVKFSDALVSPIVIPVTSIPSSGTISKTFNVPVLPRGDYNITVTTNYSPADTISIPTFTITPQVFLGSTTVKAGDQLTINGNGFAASDRITIYIDSVPRATLSAVSSNSTGQFTNAQITIPQISGGTHTITASDLDGVSLGATFTVVSDITLSASTGAVGSSIEVSGTGFAASSALTFFLDSTAINVSASTNASGNFSNVDLTIPAIAGGTHTLKVQDASSNSATKSFSVTAIMSIGPTTGPVDTTVAIIGKGFLASIPISVSYDGATVTTLVSLASGTDGSVNASFKIPASASGVHVVAVSDGTNAINANFTVSSTSGINVTSGPVGTSVTASGSGFKNKGNITITYNNAQVATATADTHGSFTSTFKIPEASTGPHSVVISDQTNTQTYTFSVTATFIPLSPTSGPIGTNITVGGNGFGASKTITVTYDSSPVTLTTPGTTDTNGTFTVSFKAPVSKGGNHTITVTDGIVPVQTFTFALDSTPPSTPTLSSPASLTKLAKIPTLSWTPVTDSNGGITYTLQISKDNTFASVLIEKKGLTSPSYTLDTKIPVEKLKSVSKNTPYYWRVRATDAASNTSAWTTPQTFLVGLALADYAVYIIMGAIAIMLGVLGFVLGRLTKRPY
jgi:hypothetical protein